jgi:hypothetical protein
LPALSGVSSVHKRVFPDSCNKGGWTMRYRKLGNTDLEVSVLAFGCFAMGKWLWGNDVEDRETIDALR